MKRTEVRGVLGVAHTRDGVLHGHTYAVWARFQRREAYGALADLNAVLARYDHSHLPAEVFEGEDLAEAIGEALTGCDRVRIVRDLEGIAAEWTP